MPGKAAGPSARRADDGLSFIPVVGQATWLGLGWLMLAYDFTSFAMDRRRLSFREKWRLLLANLPGAPGFGAAVFLLMVVPLVSLVILPAAAVAGTMLFLDIEGRSPSSTPGAIPSAGA